MRLVLFALFILGAQGWARTDFSLWKDSVRIYINTSPTGAALTAPLKNFPLLVRLDSSNFTLSSASPGGADIRFTDPDGVELPCHVERWDTGFYRSAEVWVNVPQVDAGGTTDFVVMYWGNPSAVMTGAVKARQGTADVYLGADNAVSSRFVFDTAYGFSAVWHLDEDVPGVGTKKAHRDASPAGNHGDDSAQDPSGAGVVGRAQQFDAGTDYISVANSPTLQLEGPMSFSAWIKADAFSGIGAGATSSQVNPIVRKGEANNNPYQFCVAGGSLTLPLDTSDQGGVRSAQPLETGKWTHVGGVWDGTRVQLYVNGALSADQAPTGTVTFEKDTRPIYIGGRPIKAGDAASLDLFDGQIDEIQVSHTARSKEWFRLEYENQKPGSALLSFKSVRPKVQAGADEVYSTWSHARKLILNTSVTGSDVKSSVTRFPLVVRLKAANFDFSQAHIYGYDIRFADADGSHLPFSIERWDAGKSVAEVWVRVPQVDGGGKADFITMYWGKSGAAIMNASSPVFDTADGFSGAWHMNTGEAGKTGAVVFRDATYNGNHGADFTGADPSEGVIGLGQEFGGAAGNKDFIRIPASPSLNPGTAFSFSAWVKGRTFYQTTDQVNAILRKGEANPNVYEFYVRKGSPGVSLNTGDGNGRNDSTVLEVGSWYHLAATWGSAGKLQFYVNGIRTGSTIKAEAMVDDLRPLYIGGRDAVGPDSNDQFDGFIDEVQFAHVERGADWIKLAYENQRPDSRLVEFAAPVVPADTTVFIPAPADDTILAPGQSLIRKGLIKVANPADAPGPLRVIFSPAADRSSRGIAEAGEGIALKPAVAGQAMPKAGLEINTALSGNVSLFLALTGESGQGTVKSFGAGIGSWEVAESGEYFMGRDTAAPLIEFIGAGVTEDDSSWLEVRTKDNVENLRLAWAVGGVPGDPIEAGTYPAHAGKPVRLAFKGTAGREIRRVSLVLQDGTLESGFPAGTIGSFRLERRLAEARAPVGLKKDKSWNFVGMPLRLPGRFRFSDAPVAGAEDGMFGAVWVNREKPDTSGYVLLKGGDSLPTGTGIWLAGRADMDTLPLGEAFTNLPSPDGSYRIRLVKGWNQVTSPVPEKMPWPVTSRDTVARDLSRIKVLQGVHPGSGAYFDADSLEPWRGFFVHSALDTTVELRPPRSGQVRKPAAARASQGPSAAIAIPVQVVVEPLPMALTGAGTGAVSPVRLGAALYARDEVGIEDERMPPPAGDGPILAAVRGGMGLKSDLLAFRPARDFTWKMAWSARRTAYPAIARLRVGAVRLPAGMALWAASPLRKVAMPATVGMELVVEADAADTLIFWAAPMGMAYGGLPPGYAPVPSGRSAIWAQGPGGGSLRLALPEAAGIRAECRDVSGRLLAELRRDALAPGYYEFPLASAWKGAGAAPRMGLMLVTLRFDGGAGPARMVLKTAQRP
ncbi:MAG: flagellar motor protein MotA [Fibrobacteres bacterium]|nr:flagellar motor protein MotA [Fibrobacterota bacterium]